MNPSASREAAGYSFNSVFQHKSCFGFDDFFLLGEKLGLHTVQLLRELQKGAAVCPFGGGKEGGAVHAGIDGGQVIHRHAVLCQSGLLEFQRVLRPGGHLLVPDFSMPEGILAAPYRLYLHRMLPNIAGWVTGNSGAYDYLGESIEAFPCGAEFCCLMKD